VYQNSKRLRSGSFYFRQLCVCGETLTHLSFSREKRLLSNRQFKAVLAHGIRSRNELFTLYIAENDKGQARLGISVRRSSGKSVVRNRIKRLVREAFRQSQDMLPVGFDYLVLVSPELSADLHKKETSRKILNLVTFERVRTSLLGLIKKAMKKHTRNRDGEGCV